jgi:hypothetical protein
MSDDANTINATPIVDPVSLYDVALATDRVLKIKRSQE